MSDTYDFEPPLDLDPEPELTASTPDYLNLQCKYCHKTGLHWEKTRSGKYYLATIKGTKHTCKESCGFSKLPKGKKSGSKK
jgi:hypothetical protein